MKTEREIWFYKVLWSYIPCHWKGFALIAAFASTGLIAIFIAQWSLRQLEIHNADMLPLLLLVPAVIGATVIAERHS